LCISIVMYIILIICFYMATLTEVFPCFLLRCKANAKVKPPNTGHSPHFLIFVLFCVLFVLCLSVYCLFCVVLFIVCFVSFCALFVCICVLYYCHRMATQLQLIDISNYTKHYKNLTKYSHRIKFCPKMGQL
jgi:hypothetical protein